MYWPDTRYLQARLSNPCASRIICQIEAHRQKAHQTSQVDLFVVRILCRLSRDGSDRNDVWSGSGLPPVGQRIFGFPDNDVSAGQERVSAVDPEQYLKVISMLLIIGLIWTNLGLTWPSMGLTWQRSGWWCRCHEAPVAEGCLYASDLRHLVTKWQKILRKYRS